MPTEDSRLRLVVSHDKQASPVQGLYLITDEALRLVERVRSAIIGGARVVQFRPKLMSDDEKIAVGTELRRICREMGVIFIVNDSVALARDLDADGVHLGQEDGSVQEARAILPPGRIVGVSTHNLKEALKAQGEGADYIGFGSMFPTATKIIQHQPGPKGLAEIRPQIKIPIVAIGGITRDNTPEIIDSGADAVAIISAVMGAQRPSIAAAEIATLFNRKLAAPRGCVLTVAGSDSGGGAGIQADLKTITLLGSYAASVLTALTAQNTRGVAAIHGVPPDFVAAQLDAVLSDIPVDVVKTGMLYSVDIIEVLADKLKEYGKKLLVADPVMTAKGGSSLISTEAAATFKKFILPETYLLTPNIPEAEKLTGRTIQDEAGMEDAARMLFRMGAANVLLKGGHLTEGNSVDIFFDGSTFQRFTSPRILTRNTHGTGCTLASAISAFLAAGEPLPIAVRNAKEFITTAIKLAHPLGKGHGPVNHYLAAKETL